MVGEFVCVWTICKDVKLPSVCFVLLLLVQQDFLLYMQGDGVCFRCLHPTKTHLLHSDMDWGRSIHVPAQSFSFPSMATGQAKNRHVDLFSISFLHSCHNLPFLTFMTDKAASKLSSEQGRRKHSSN